ncbi:hypothetical protein HRE53_25470 [Acaryochloris sp. 'Moss Beach']|uniref:hypothetical protein n=1 Tax=Acaryochloris sp. 'Moss Beach' TaxID=2740837 RepID=UPI001F3F8648|nr:hypothetical protein [Acaryochloris sp. 'Moss Beach']UJB69615.1 hypothetical protein HRE53_25470 [Acaryochloris sp. 'Moss Beach']
MTTIMGASGGILTHRLASSGKTILVLERCSFPLGKRPAGINVFYKDRCHTDQTWQTASGHLLKFGTLNSTILSGAIR